MRQALGCRGETLVEAIVSFAVILIVLLGATVLVQSAINLNRRAYESMEALEMDMAAIEKDNGPTSAAAPDGALRLSVGDVLIDVPVLQKEQGQLRYFMPIPGGIAP